MTSRNLMVGAIFAATIVGGGGAARTAILPVDAAYSTHSISSARMAERSDNASGGTRSLTGPNGPANAQVNAVGNSNPSPSADNSDGRHGDPKNPTPILALAVSEPATWGMMVLGVCLMAVGLRMMRAKPVKTGASAGERFYTA